MNKKLNFEKKVIMQLDEKMMSSIQGGLAATPETYGCHESTESDKTCTSCSCEDQTHEVEDDVQP